MNGVGAVGGFVMPTAAKREVERKKRELGENPPSDLEYSYIKD